MTERQCAKMGRLWYARIAFSIWSLNLYPSVRTSMMMSVYHCILPSLDTQIVASVKSQSNNSGIERSVEV